jgi:uncharacterized protein YidB (DUF937 family)
MGLLESMLGSALGSGQQTGSMGDILGGLLSNSGGIDGLVAKFNASGMGDVVGSWIGKGENLPISADQISSVLGSDAVAGLAAKLGIDPAQASTALSAMLPGLIDKLTPHGTTEGVDEAAASAGGNGGDLMGMLGGLMQPR